jgi:hypothetical protein
VAKTDDNKSTEHGATDKGGTVLVPPAGVHTPGTTAHGDGQPLVEAPADAFSDPEAAAKAHQDAQAGKVAKVGPPELANQNADGSAMTPQELADAEKAEKEQADRYGDPTAKPDGITK